METIYEEPIVLPEEDLADGAEPVELPNSYPPRTWVNRASRLALSLLWTCTRRVLKSWILTMAAMLPPATLRYFPGFLFRKTALVFPAIRLYSFFFIGFIVLVILGIYAECAWLSIRYARRTSLPMKLYSKFMTAWPGRVVHSRTILDAVRQKYKWLPVTRFRAKVANNHAHCAAADLRCNATSSINAFVKSLGLRRYDVSTSTREAKFKVAGSRHHYTAADLRYDQRDDELLPGDFVTMVDVDYYATPHRYAPHPMAIYTFAPSAIAGETLDSYWYYDSDGKLHERIAGGAHYCSEVWNYDADQVMIWNGLHTTLYAVEKIPQPNTKGRLLVFMLPIVTFRWMPLPIMVLITAVFRVLHVWESVVGLNRADNVATHGQYVRGTWTDKNGNVTVSIRHGGIPGKHCVNVPIEKYLAIRKQAKVDRYFGPKSVEEIVKLGTPADYHLVADYFASNPEIPEYPRVAYQCAGSREMEQGFSAAEQTVPALVTNPAVTPTDSRNNDEHCVRTRVEAVANTNDPGAEIKGFGDEFIALLAKQLPSTEQRDKAKAPTEFKLTPVALDQVYDNQNKPLQIERTKRAQHRCRGKNRVKANQKKESYTDPSDPRNISGVETDHTIAMSTYMYAMKNFLVRFAWFFPSRKPASTADGIHRYVHRERAAGRVTIATDYSRFDGTISAYLKQLEGRIYTRLFGWSEKLNTLIEGDSNCDAKTKHGVRYNTGSSRLSGSPTTTIGNTLINAFVAYCVHRRSGLGPDEAFSRIGPKYGDDSVDTGKEDVWVGVCEELGLRIKIAERLTWVDFCGRVYYEPEKSANSCPLVTKALTKIPVSVQGDNQVPNKVLGYLGADPEIPVLSTYCHALRRVYKWTDDKVKVTTSRESTEAQFKVTQGPYPFQVNDAFWSYLAEETGRDVPALQQLDDDLRSAYTVAELRACSRVINNNQKELAPGMKMVDKKANLKCTGAEVGGEELQKQTPKLSYDATQTKSDHDTADERPVAEKGPKRKKQRKRKNAKGDKPNAIGATNAHVPEPTPAKPSEPGIQGNGLPGHHNGAA